jgi:hypothetical protein
MFHGGGQGLNWAVDSKKKMRENWQNTGRRVEIGYTKLRNNSKQFHFIQKQLNCVLTLHVTGTVPLAT